MCQEVSEDLGVVVGGMAGAPACRSHGGFTYLVGLPYPSFPYCGLSATKSPGRFKLTQADLFNSIAIRPAPPDNGAPEEKPGLHAHTTSGGAKILSLAIAGFRYYH